MGYTSTWLRPSELHRERFAAAVADCADVVPTLGVALGGFDGYGDPIFRPDHIVFNGRQPLACEPFEVARVELDRRGRPLTRSYCKTERLPYDLCVKAALIILSHHLGEHVEVQSDGTIDEWDAAQRSVIRLKGYGSKFRLTPGDRGT